jgi:hypothetical protein
VADLVVQSVVHGIRIFFYRITDRYRSATVIVVMVTICKETDIP